MSEISEVSLLLMEYYQKESKFPSFKDRITVTIEECVFIIVGQCCFLWDVTMLEF